VIKSLVIKSLVCVVLCHIEIVFIVTTAIAAIKIIVFLVFYHKQIISKTESGFNRD
ncbi:hypothetical protein ACJX0J_034229, partial [Zea mays]